MKKTLVLLITVLMILGLAGCKSDATGSQKSETSAKESDAVLNNITLKEESITIGKGTDYELGGTLTIPEGARTPYPSVVLVQGSDPSDRDETIYNNKPFKDIADFLASKGIAVLRYDKRTYTYQEKIAADLGSFTVKDKLIDDTVSAADLLKSDSRMDKNKVFLLATVWAV